MQLEEYFDFLAPDDIRLRGTRIGIESVLYEYIFRGKTAESIAEQFPTVSLEQVYAAILYYLRNREMVERYVAEWIAFSRDACIEQNREPSPAVLRLRQRKAEHEASRIAKR